MRELLQLGSPSPDPRAAALFDEPAERERWLTRLCPADGPLLPLLARVCSQGPTVLRAASLREELRMRAFREEARDLWSVLRGFPLLFTGEAALAALVYPGPVRHAGSLELLLESPAVRDEAERALRKAGWQGRPLRGPRGVPVQLRSTWPGPFPVDFAALAREARPHPWETGRLPAREDLLLETLLAPWGPRPEPFPWEVDARFCLLEPVEETRLWERARQAGCFALAAGSWQVLGRQPPDQGSPTTRLAGDLAVATARRRCGGLLRLLGRVRDPFSWLQVARFLLLPSTGYRRWRKEGGLGLRSSRE